MQRSHLSPSKIYIDSPFGLFACIFAPNVSKTAAYLFALVAKLRKAYSTYVAVPMTKSCGFALASTGVRIENKRIAAKIKVGIQNPVIGVKIMMNTGRIRTPTASNREISLANVRTILTSVK